MSTRPGPARQFRAVRRPQTTLVLRYLRRLYSVPFYGRGVEDPTVATTSLHRVLFSSLTARSTLPHRSPSLFAL